MNSDNGLVLLVAAHRQELLRDAEEYREGRYDDEWGASDLLRLVPAGLAMVLLAVASWLWPL